MEATLKECIHKAMILAMRLPKGSAERDQLTDAIAQMIDRLGRETEGRHGR